MIMHSYCFNSSSSTTTTTNNNINSNQSNKHDSKQLGYNTSNSNETSSNNSKLGTTQTHPTPIAPCSIHLNQDVLTVTTTKYTQH